LNEKEQETAKKPTSNRSPKERRNTLFRVLDGVLSLSHKKNSCRGKQRQGKAGVLAAGFDFVAEKAGIMLFRRPKRFSFYGV